MPVKGHGQPFPDGGLRGLVKKKADQMRILVKAVAAAAFVVYSVNLIGFPSKAVAWLVITIIRAHLFRRFAKEIFQFPVRLRLQHLADIGKTGFLCLLYTSDAADEL